MDETLAKRAFSYLRVSGKAQVDGDGFPRQRHAIKEYAASHGMEVAQEFSERAVSGKTEWDNRPAWGQMMLAMEDAGVSTIIVEGLHRLARDLIVQERIIVDLKQRGIRLISVQEPDLCSDDPTRILLRQIMGAVAAYERTMIYLKLKGARERRKQQTGRCEGRKPYGFFRDESRILKRIKELRAAGEEYGVIALALNDEKLPSRSGVPWREQTVAKIMRRITIEEGGTIAPRGRRPGSRPKRAVVLNE